MEEKVITSKTFETLNDLYEKAKLQLKDQRNDGDKSHNPYFENVILFINELLQGMKNTNGYFVKLIAMKSSLLFEQSKVLFTKNEISLSLEVLKEALDTIKDMRENPHVIYLYFRVLNHYAYMLAKNNECESAKIHLEEADRFYRGLQTKNTILVYATDDLFQDNYLLKGNNILKFEKLMTNNYQMLAWVCNKMELMEEFLIFHHIVLKRQLDTHDGHPYTWVYRAAKVASYFCGLNKFKEARHHLLAAQVTLQNYELELLRFRKEPQFPNEWDTLQHYYADLGKHWLKYALFLFSASRGKTHATNKTHEQFLDELLCSSLACLNVSDPKDDKTQEKSENAHHKSGDKVNEKLEEKFHETSPDKVSFEQVPKPAEETKDKTDTSPEKSDKSVGNDNESQPKVSALESYDFTFPSLDLRNKEDTVLADLIQTPEEARSLFMHAQEWIRRAKNYYNIRDHTLENINLILDLNELYKHLANYEYEFDSQYSVQKRRSDILETLISALKELKPQCYLAVSIELLRELTEVQIDLITLNLKKLCSIRTTSTPNVSACYQESVRKLESLSVICDHLGQSTTSL